MKQILIWGLLLLSPIASIYAMEEQAQEPRITEGIIARGTRIQLKNGTQEDILLNIDEHQPYILLKPEDTYSLNSDEVNSVKAGYVNYSIVTITARWHQIDIKKLEDSYWVTDVQAVIKPGYRNNLYVGEDYQIASSDQDQRSYDANRWADYLLENSAIAKRFLSMKRASKEEVESTYGELLKEINQGQWLDANFTNLVRKSYINKAFKVLQDIIIGIELQLKNDTKFPILVKMAKSPQFELKPGETCVLNTQEIKKIKVGYTKPSFSIGLSSRWTKIEIRDLEKIYRQQAVLMHLQPALNNNINVSSIEKKNNLLSLGNEFESITESEFDLTLYR